MASEIPITIPPLLDRIIFDKRCARNYSGLTPRVYVFYHEECGHMQNHELLKMIDKGKDMFNQNESRDPYNDKENESFCITSTFKPYGKNTSDGDEPETISFKCLAFDINTEKSSFNVKSQGQTNGKTYTSELNVTLLGRSDAETEFAESLITLEHHIGVIFQDNNGDFRIMGSTKYPMSIDFEENTAEGPAAEAASKIKFVISTKKPPVYFKGKIQATVSVIDTTITQLTRSQITVDCAEKTEIFNSMG